jgi:hypothetical protein
MYNEHDFDPRRNLGLYFVVLCGEDCDGYNSGYVYSYCNKKAAEISAFHSNEASDGIWHEVVDTEGMINYCDQFPRLTSTFYIEDAYDKLRFFMSYDLQDPNNFNYDMKEEEFWNIFTDNYYKSIQK